MNSERIINGWIAQLNLDARDRGANRHPPVARLVPMAPAIEATAQPALPARPRARRLPVRAWAREGARRRALGQPCLSLG
jgi:hypothetical protein